MKRFFLFIGLLLSMAHVLAQGPSSSVEHSNNPDSLINSIIWGLDFTDVSSGLLLERSIAWADPAAFDGQAVSDSNLLGGIDDFGLVYATVSGMGLSGPALPDPEATYVLPSYNLTAADPIPIAVLFYDYHAFREDAISQGLLEWQDNAGGGRA
jgi:hypothetical protein